FRLKTLRSTIPWYGLAGASDVMARPVNEAHSTSPTSRQWQLCIVLLYRSVKIWETKNRYSRMVNEWRILTLPRNLGFVRWIWGARPPRALPSGALAGW